mmetsp:Transcript_7880/g.15638  ORF Transcript_7880/g.15638 Transcript_7880/m.15638 type:complete len:253 (-) Transcript_7880:544-1302(-)
MTLCTRQDAWRTRAASPPIRACPQTFSGFCFSPSNSVSRNTTPAQRSFRYFSPARPHLETEPPSKSSFLSSASSTRPLRPLQQTLQKCMTKWTSSVSSIRSGMLWPMGTCLETSSKRITRSANVVESFYARLMSRPHFGQDQLTTSSRTITTITLQHRRICSSHKLHRQAGSLAEQARRSLQPQRAQEDSLVEQARRNRLLRQAQEVFLGPPHLHLQETLPQALAVSLEDLREEQLLEPQALVDFLAIVVIV